MRRRSSPRRGTARRGRRRCTEFEQAQVPHIPTRLWRRPCHRNEGVARCKQRGLSLRPLQTQGTMMNKLLAALITSLAVSFAFAQATPATSATPAAPAAAATPATPSADKPAAAVKKSTKVAKKTAKKSKKTAKKDKN